MSLKTRRLVILISVISLLFVLILNFFVLQKSEEEKYFESIQAKIQKVNTQFDEDFIRVLMDVRPETHPENCFFGLITPPLLISHLWT
jgi:two-component system, NtrC family, nitrogen regulation sensor histidine kinase NtrY